tara:strand:- start:50 stop:526 length:477 start_codon:yes stop_codon:yes gene_type:complete
MAAIAFTGAMAAFACPVICPAPATAQTVQEMEPLVFGTFVVPSNAAVSTLTIPLSGSVSTTGSIIALTQGMPGRYRVGGLPGSAIVDIDVNAAPLFGAAVPASQFFQITAFDHPPTVITNAGGTATFRLGATLSTSGSGVPYTESTYTGTIDITVTLQ